MDYDIKDNFLDKDAFKFIEEQLMGSHFPWFFQPGVVEEGDDGLWTYLAHQFFAENRPQSNYMQLLQPLLDSITPKANADISVDGFGLVIGEILTVNVYGQIAQNLTATYTPITVSQTPNYTEITL